MAPLARAVVPGYPHHFTRRANRRQQTDLEAAPPTGVTSKSFSQQWTKTESGTPVAELDALGNWRKFRQDTTGNGSYNGSDDMTQTRTNNAVNELTGFGELSNPPTPGQAAWVDPAYDAAGNMVKSPKPGELADGATMHHYVYDAWNRLVAVYQDDGDGDLETGGQIDDDSVVGQYQYDGRNYRVVKLVPHGGPAIAPTHWDRTDFYYNENWQVLEERFGANIPSPAGGGQGEGATTTHIQWLWDIRYIDAPVLRWRNADNDSQTGAGGMEETLYYCNDANMNVTALVDAATGGVVERYVYNPYGKLTTYDANWANSLAYSRLGNPFTYTGRELDNETGLMHYRARTYDPVQGRFKQTDPIGVGRGTNLSTYVNSLFHWGDGQGIRHPKSAIGYFPIEGTNVQDGINLYQYCGSDPVSHVDATGLRRVLLALMVSDASQAGFDAVVVKDQLLGELKAHLNLQNDELLMEIHKQAIEVPTTLGWQYDSSGFAWGLCFNKKQWYGHYMHFGKSLGMCQTGSNKTVCDLKKVDTHFQVTGATDVNRFWTNIIAHEVVHLGAYDGVDWLNAPEGHIASSKAWSIDPFFVDADWVRKFKNELDIK